MDVHIDGNVVYCVDPDGEYVLADCNEEEIPDDESDDEEEVKRQLDELRDVLLAYKGNSQENQLDDKIKRQIDELNKVTNPTDMFNIACESMEIQKSIVRHEGRIKRIIQRAQQQDQHHGDAQNTK